MRHVMRLRTSRCPGQEREDRRPARAGAALAFEHEKRSRFTEVQAAARAVEGTARLGIERAERLEPEERQGAERVRTSRERNVHEAATHPLPRLNDREAAARASRARCRRSGARAEHTRESLGGGAERLRQEAQRANRLELLGRRGEEIALGFEHGAGRPRMSDTESAASVTSDGERLARRDERERIRARPHVPLVSRSDARNVEALDLCRETRARVFGIERANRRKPALAGHEPARTSTSAPAPSADTTPTPVTATRSNGIVDRRGLTSGA